MAEKRTPLAALVIQKIEDFCRGGTQLTEADVLSTPDTATEAAMKRLLACQTQVLKERSELEERLKLSRINEQDYRVLFQTSPIPQCRIAVDSHVEAHSIWDLITNIGSSVNAVSINRAALTLFEARNEKAFCDRPQEYLLLTPEKNGVPRKRHGWVTDAILETKSAKSVHLLVECAWPLISDTPTNLAVVSFVDISEHKIFEAKLRDSQKFDAISKLAGGIAHDFNNLLTILLMTIADLEQELADNTLLLEKLSVMDEAGKRATALTRQLLAFSQRGIIRPSMLRLDECVSATVPMLSRMIKHDVKIEYHPTKTKPIKLDIGQINQIILNLASNAGDAMPQGGTITICVEDCLVDQQFVLEHPEAELGPGVMLSMKDTGTGIDENIMDRIFDPYFTTKEKGKGTGLGLATVFGAVKQNGGFILVDSKVGQGTTFKIYFPLRQEKETIAATAKKIVDLDQPLTITVLVAEDEDAVREAVASMLRKAGCTVITAINGVEAIEKYTTSNTKIDLLLTDVVMPEMNGKELSEKLKIIQPSLPIIFMSGFTENIVFDDGVVQTGAFFLEKPFARQDLIELIHEAID